ncbi:MAG: FkbM family methyltransferase [Bacteroidota bacterium]
MTSYLKKLVSKIKFRLTKEGIEINRLRGLERNTPTTTDLLGVQFHIVDPASFIGQYFEIIKNEIYLFSSASNPPYIIDCGANVGTSVYYFNKLYPDAKIIAFEADKAVFGVLKKNISQMQGNIEAVNKAVWDKNGVIDFFIDGSDAGSVLSGNSKGRKVSVETTGLRDYLNTRVNFLKIDIEGAERQVLENCADLLNNVDNIFIEYHSVWNKKQDLDVILKILADNDFRFFIEQVNVFNKSPFVSKKRLEQYDNLLNIYAQKNAPPAAPGSNEA